MKKTCFMYLSSNSRRTEERGYTLCLFFLKVEPVNMSVACMSSLVFFLVFISLF